MQCALKKMKNGKYPGEDPITSEMIKLGGGNLTSVPQTLMNKCLQEANLPTEW